MQYSTRLPPPAYTCIRLLADAIGIQRRICDQGIDGSTPGWTPLRSDFGQAIHTYAPLPANCTVHSEP